MKEIHIVFIDDKEETLKAQDEQFLELLPKFGVTSHEKTYDGFSFVLSGINILVSKRYYYFSLEKSGDPLPDEVKNKANELKNELKDKKTLFVIDLCLDGADDYRTGKELQKFLIGTNNVMYDFMFTTSTVAFIDDENTIFRAVSGDGIFDNDACARKICKFYPKEAKEVKAYKKIKGILNLLESNRRNYQYFGAIVFKAIELSKKTM